MEFDPEPDYSDDNDDGVGSSAERSQHDGKSAKQLGVGESHIHDRHLGLPDDSNQSYLHRQHKMLSQNPTGKALFFEEEDEGDDEVIDRFEHIDTQRIEQEPAEHNSQKTRDNQSSSKLKSANHFKDAKHRNIKDKLENFSPGEAERERLAQQIGKYSYIMYTCITYTYMYVKYNCTYITIAV